MIRVRFAPSPTGNLHIGGVRTALFNYLYARTQKGTFLLRIEDTDRQRSKPEYESEILSSLEWLGLKCDEEILRQSGRLGRYQSAARTLLERKLAYEEKVRAVSAIKFKVPACKAVFEDLVHGKTQFDTALFEDVVLIKSDGFPSYHWACVVDDHEMAITHVIRGADHLSNTPRQILLFEAMGWKVPKYAHLPLIVGADGTPLSKRHGAVSLGNFRDRGYLPEGLLNYLALLGWGSGDDEEVHNLEALVKKFSLKRVQKSNARFNPVKLDWINAQHIRRLPEAEYLKRITAFHEALAKRFPAETWRRLALLYRSRIKTLRELEAQASYCFSEIEAYDPNLYNDFLQNRLLKRHLEAWLERAAELPDFRDPEAVEAMTRETAQGWGIEAKDLIHPIRFAVSGQTVTPGLFELMSVLGKETCLKRVKRFLQK